jgi:soluble lytic murein transglycosylase-like protein
VTFLAAAGFATALLLTPTAQLDLPLVRVAQPKLGLTQPNTEPAPVLPADSATLETAVVNRYDHLPLAQIFRRRADAETANRVARAIVKEARELQISPSLLAGVLITENSRLEPETISHRGAVGLMQVMPFWPRELGMTNDQLVRIADNVRMGTTILGYYLRKERGNYQRALQRYNGSLGRPTYSDMVLDRFVARWRIEP